MKSELQPVSCNMNTRKIQLDVCGLVQAHKHTNTNVTDLIVQAFLK